MHVLLSETTNIQNQYIIVKCKTNMVSYCIIFKVLPRLTRSPFVKCSMRNFCSIFEGTHGFRTTNCMVDNNTICQAHAEWDDNRQQYYIHSEKPSHTIQSNTTETHHFIHLPESEQSHRSPGSYTSLSYSPDQWDTCVHTKQLMFILTMIAYVYIAKIHHSHFLGQVRG